MQSELEDSTPPSQTETLSAEAQLGFYVDLYKNSIQVQMHFNDIAWRIRGLALTAATFAIGAGSLAARFQLQIGYVSVGALLIVICWLLWYAFYFVDRHWYHPLLKGAVDDAREIEKAIQSHLPAAGVTTRISQASPYKPGAVVRFFSCKDSMNSTERLGWFYKVGWAVLLLAAVGFQLSTMLAEAPEVDSASLEEDVVASSAKFK